MFQRLRRNLSRHLFGKDPHYRDPYEDAGEQFYGRIYLKYLFESIEMAFPHRPIEILDVGCHTGRLTIPLAQAGHRVTGIDSSRFHIKRAKGHARHVGVNCRFLRKEGFGYLRHLPPESFDFVVCTEVLYQRPDFRDCLEALLQVLRKGGLLATSHRTRFFYLSRSIRERDFETAQFLLKHSEGKLWGSYFNWQTPSELKDLYQKLGADSLCLRPIGVFTGNGEEGMAKLCDLGEAKDSERERLLEVEGYDSDELAAASRYLLVIGRKREG